MTLSKKERPAVAIPNKDAEHLPVELFQNKTLRPILKLQHDVVMAVFDAYRSRFIADWGNVKKEDKLEFISNGVLKDGALKNTLIGIIVGQLEVEEISDYLANKKDLDRRITGMVIERIQSVY